MSRLPRLISPGSSSRSSFLKDCKLHRYLLHEVVSNGKTLGVGSFGCVVEVEYGKVSCAAKGMHEILLDPSNEGVQQIIEKYQQECQVMASLRHPNIIQFLGLCFLESSRLPFIVMERLKMSVDDLLENSPAIPLPVKISILTDTCSGLLYLHSMETPIVHRDLTARNVLLTSSLTAKITDLGNSRMVSFKQGQLAQTLTKTPGTTVYMPPEALDDSHVYGASLDMFSFGHLSLFVLIQEFPGKLLAINYIDPHNPSHLIDRTEVERREVYMRNLEMQFGVPYPALVQLVTQCLHNTPQRRPTSQELTRRLKTVKLKIEDKFGGSIATQLNISNILILKEAKSKDKVINQLQVLQPKQETESRNWMEAYTRLEEEKARISQENNSLVHEKSQLENDMAQLSNDIHRVESENHQLKSINHQLSLYNESCENKIGTLKDDVEELKIQLQQCREKRKYKTIIFPLQLDWGHGPDMPVAMSSYIQLVEIDGTLYVGGGYTDKNEDLYIIMTYSTKSCEWHTLPPSCSRWFGMTVINNRLVLVGGLNRNNLYNNDLEMWQPGDNQWTYPYPPMPSPHKLPSVNTHKRWLIVAGGFNRRGYCLSCEVLDLSNEQWSIGPAMPKPWEYMKSVAIGDTWYLMGGWDGKTGEFDVYNASLESITSCSSSDDSTIWKKLPSLNCTYSSPLNLAGSLLAVGGRDEENKKSVSTIQRYVPKTNTWNLAGELPHARHNCTCVIASDDKLYVIGGHNKRTRLNQMFTAYVL